MGGLHTLEFAEMVKNGEIDLNQALHYHLTSNHYPSVSPAFIPVVKQAINIANEAIVSDDESLWNTELELPNGNKATVSQIVNGLHLDWFLNRSEE